MGKRKEEGEGDPGERVAAAAGGIGEARVRREAPGWLYRRGKRWRWRRGGHGHALRVLL